MELSTTQIPFDPKGNEEQTEAAVVHATVMVGGGIVQRQAKEGNMEAAKESLECLLDLINNPSKYIKFPAK